MLRTRNFICDRRRKWESILPVVVAVDFVVGASSSKCVDGEVHWVFDLAITFIVLVESHTVRSSAWFCFCIITSKAAERREGEKESR